MATERANRSDKYQHFLLEVSVSDTYLESFDNSQSISTLLNPFEYSEEYLQLKDDLKKEFWKLAEEVCTERQFEIMQMLCQGMTQTEIANKLGVNQSSITKSLNGNLDYNKNRKVYGGLIKKMKKHVETHIRINEILERMSEIREQKW